MRSPDSKTILRVSGGPKRSNLIEALEQYGAARRLPSGTAEQKESRNAAMSDAKKRIIQGPGANGARRARLTGAIGGRHRGLRMTKDIAVKIRGSQWALSLNMNLDLFNRKIDWAGLIKDKPRDKRVARVDFDDKSKRAQVRVLNKNTAASRGNREWPTPRPEGIAFLLGWRATKAGYRREPDFIAVLTPKMAKVGTGGVHIYWSMEAIDLGNGTGSLSIGPEKDLANNLTTRSSLGENVGQWWIWDGSVDEGWGDRWDPSVKLAHDPWSTKSHNWLGRGIGTHSDPQETRSTKRFGKPLAPFWPKNTKLTSPPK